MIDLTWENTWFLGKKVLDLFVSQYVMNKYPKLPAPVCASIVDAYIGQASLASVGKSCGIQFVTRWKVARFLYLCPVFLPIEQLILDD